MSKHVYERESKGFLKRALIFKFFWCTTSMHEESFYYIRISKCACHEETSNLLDRHTGKSKLINSY